MSTSLKRLCLSKQRSGRCKCSQSREEAIKGMVIADLKQEEGCDIEVDVVSVTLVASVPF